MRKLTIKVQQGAEIMAMRVVALATYGDIAVHHPHDDDERFYLTLTHIPTGRAVLDDFVIDARLTLTSLAPIILEVAGIFRGGTVSLNEIDKAVLNALVRVLERMEAELPVRMSVL